MRISRYRKKEEPKKIYRFNEGITAPQVLVIDPVAGKTALLNTREAITMAREQGLDLVEINPKAEPPVAKMIDYGQFKYQLEKEARIAKAHQHVIDIKGIRLSLRIGPHDTEIRRNQTIKFLNSGDKVKIEIILRGRELQRVPQAIELIKRFISDVNQIVSVRTEQATEKSANKVTAIIAKN